MHLNFLIVYYILSFFLIDNKEIDYKEKNFQTFLPMKLVKLLVIDNLYILLLFNSFAAYGNLTHTNHFFYLL